MKDFMKSATEYSEFKRLEESHELGVCVTTDGVRIAEWIY
jgi:putative hemolysin